MGRQPNSNMREGASPDRITRVNEILKREIAGVIQYKDFNEGGALVSVTKVQCSTDLKQATVYISFFGLNADGKKLVFERLAGLRGEIQRRVSRHIVLKYTPILSFTEDRNIEEGDRVLQILRELEDKEGGIEE